MRPHREPSNAAGLPIVRVGGVEYVLDLRLKQLRKLDEPRKAIDLREEPAGVGA